MLRAMSRFPRLAAVITVLYGAAGCASTSGWVTEQAGPDFPDGMHVLGEVIVVASRNDALAGQGLFRRWPAKLAEAGYGDADITDASEVTVWAWCYGHNSGVPLCTHHGHFVAHVPPPLRHVLRGDSNDDPDSEGDLVEVALHRVPSGAIVGEVVAVYRSAGNWLGCRDAFLQRGAVESGISSLAGVGPPRGSWIECEDVASDGWQRLPVPGAPLPSSGPPVSLWFKPPG